MVRSQMRWVGICQVLLKLEMNSDLYAQLNELNISAAKEIELGVSDWTVNSIFMTSYSAEISAETPALLECELEKK